MDNPTWKVCGRTLVLFALVMMFAWALRPEPSSIELQNSAVPVVPLSES